MLVGRDLRDLTNLVVEHALAEEGHDERVYAMMRASHERSC